MDKKRVVEITIKVGTFDALCIEGGNGKGENKSRVTDDQVLWLLGVRSEGVKILHLGEGRPSCGRSCNG